MRESASLRSFALARGWAVACVLGAGLAAPAVGQSAGEASSPMDVNATRPGQPGASQVSGTGIEATGEDGAKYRVSRFEVRYFADNEGNPALETVLAAPVELGVLSTGYVAPREGLKTTTIRVGDVVEGTMPFFYRSALDEVRRSVYNAVSSQGLFGVVVLFDQEDVDEANDRDLRAGQRGAIRLVVYTGKVQQVRTIASGDRLMPDSGDESTQRRINNPDPVHARIRLQSPAQPGGVVRRDDLSAYVSRLNRHPGRRVEVAVAPAVGPDNPEDVVVDFHVAEMRPWRAYAQVSNTGTRQTNEWREVFGYVNNQLTGHDDTLSVNYITGGFTDANAVTASYEFPLRSDILSMRLYGAYSEFDASEVGQASESFSGRTYQIGTEVTGTVYQQQDSFIDLFGGVRYQDVSVTDTLLLPSPQAEGQTAFLIPYLGVRYSRETPAMSTRASLSVEGNLAGIAATESYQLDRLGRRNADKAWTTVKVSGEHSMYLEPLFGKGGPFGETLAHEVAFRVGYQDALGSRLIANEQEVQGGMFTVRGYPESVAAGDNAAFASLEYRYHVPRAFAISEPGTLGGKSMPKVPWVENFRWAPQVPYGTADWDLVLRGFLDVGSVSNNDRLLGEFDNTLVGAGVGVELVFRSNASLRLDWGFVLSEVDEPGSTVDTGDNRVHVMLWLAY
ncbi:MAG: ShlB/FhaC/HecB family hemolysin secretion/activation protein [Phycisphaerales bacterium]|nr:MAG: ShlB/FhaC/HecB family hemolysin secretion/activation protein [Phycisphaerales bacterium]